MVAAPLCQTELKDVKVQATWCPATTLLLPDALGKPRPWGSSLALCLNRRFWLAFLRTSAPACRLSPSQGPSHSGGFQHPQDTASAAGASQGNLLKLGLTLAHVYSPEFSAGLGGPPRMMPYSPDPLAPPLHCTPLLFCCVPKASSPCSPPGLCFPQLTWSLANPSAHSFDILDSLSPGSLAIADHCLLWVV